MKSGALVLTELLVNPTLQREYVGAGVLGKFQSNNLAENGCKILIIGQISINGSVKVLDIPDLHKTSGPIFTENILSPHDTTGWGDGGIPNQNCPVSQTRNVSVLWHGDVPACPANMTRSPENARAAAQHVHDNWLCGRRCVHMRSPSTCHNPAWNPRINCCGDYREDPVDQ